MKPLTPVSPDKGRIRALVRRGSLGDKTPPVASGEEPIDPTLCGGCGAVYHRKTWRRSVIRSARATILQAPWGTCPACVQVRAGRSYGRAILRGSYVLAHEDDLRRRTLNVVARASHTQPERRLVSWRRVGPAIEVATTSQKLAHRIVHELKKAFKGRAHYEWSDRDGSLTATWERDLPMAAGRS